MATKRAKMGIPADPGFQLVGELQPWSGGETFAPTAAQVAPEPPAQAGAMRRVFGDTAISALKSTIGVPEVLVGAADLLSGGRAGQALEEGIDIGGVNIGFRPKMARQALDEMLTPQQKAANEAVQKAEGFLETTIQALRNPSVILHAGIESLGVMGAGGVVGRSLMSAASRAAPRLAASSVAPVVAGAAGESAVTIGSQAESIRQGSEDGRLSGMQSALAVGSGAMTGLLGLLGGRIAQHLRIADIDTLMAGKAAPETTKGFVRRVLEGAASEGLLEELPQSIQEQVAQNMALGKPLGEGVPQAAVLGALTGGMMGAGFNAMSHGSAIRAEKEGLGAGPVGRAADAGREATAKHADALAAAAGVTLPPQQPTRATMAPAAAPAVAPPARRQREPRSSLADEILSLADPDERQEALGLAGTAQNKEAPGAVRRFAQNRLDEILLQVRQVPAGEATEIEPEVVSADATMGSAMTREQIAAARRAAQDRRDAAAISQPLPVGEAAPVIPTGEANEIQDIPAGDATEIHDGPLSRGGPLGEGFTPRRKTDGVLVDPSGPNAVAAYVQRIRSVNTPAARAFLQDFAAGRITRDDVMGLLGAGQPRPEPTPDERLAAAAAQAPKPDDILNPKGKPFTNRGAAANEMRRRGEGFTIAKVDGGFAVREMASPAADLEPAPAEASVSSVSSVPPVLSVPAEPAAESVAADAPVPAVPEQTAGAVVPAGLNVTFGGKTYPVESVEDAQRKWVEFQETADGGGPAGVSQVGNGIPVTDGAGRLVARVAYNGRAFGPDDQLLAEAPQQVPEAAAPEAPASPAIKPIKPRRSEGGSLVYKFTTNEGMDGQVHIAAPGFRKGVKGYEVTLDRVGGAKDERGRTKFYPTVTVGKFRTEALAVKAAERAVAEHRQAPAADEHDEALKRMGFAPTGPGPGEWVRPFSKRGDVIAKVVSGPGELLRVEISADYMGKRLGSRVAEGHAAIAEAIKTAQDGINAGRERMARSAISDEPERKPTLMGKRNDDDAPAAVQATPQPAPAAPEAAPPAPASSVAGQKNLAYRGSRIASLLAMNEQIRKLDQSEAWHPDNITDSQDLDGLQDSISSTLVRLQRERETPATTTHQEAATPEATHKDPGEPAEPVTAEVVAEVIEKAAKRTDRTRSEMKAEALRLIDEAMAEAPDKGSGKVTISVPGDGVFKVVNTKERLKEFRRQIELSPGFRDKLPKFPIGKAVSGGNYGPDQLAREMLEDGEPINAVEILEAAGKTMMFGNGNGAIPYTNAEPVDVAGIDDLFVGRGFGTKKGSTSWWSVIHKGSGLAIGGKADNKADAIAAAKKVLSQPESREKLLAIIKSGKSADGNVFMTQGELREQFMNDAEGKQKAKFAAHDAQQNRIAEYNKKAAERFDVWKSIMGADAGGIPGASAHKPWTPVLIKSLLTSADKHGRVADAIKLIDDTSSEVWDGSMAQRAVKEWEMAAQSAAAPAATEAQRQQAADHAKDLGGRVVWQRGDLALIEGYSLLSGDSVYIAANGSQRTRVDIQRYTGSGYTDAQKAELLKARSDAVKAAEDAMARNPDGPFRAGPVVFADDIPAGVQGVVRGWIALLGLDGARIVVTTPKSGAAMADGLAGKFRRIGKASLSGDNTNGTMQPLGGDDFHIAVRQNASTLKMLEVLAHEMGHIVERREFAKADATTQQAIRDAHAKWLKTHGTGLALDMAQAMRAYRSGQTTGFSDDAKAAEAGAYWRSFGEWFADQVSRWATTQKKPVGVVEQFFKRLADRLRTFFKGERAKFLPDATVAQWLGSLSKDVAPVSEVAAPAASQGDRDESGGAALKRGTGPGIDLASAQALAKQLEAAGVLRLNVVASVEDMPPHTKKLILMRAPDGRVRGAYLRSTDQVWLFSDHIRSADEFVFVAMHEAFHRGLHKTIPGARALLRQMYVSNANLKKAAQAQMSKHKIGLDEAIEEALADMAGEGTARELKGWQKLLDTIREWLVKVSKAAGLQMTWTDDMVADFVAGILREGLRGGAVHVDDGGATLSRADPAAEHEPFDLKGKTARALAHYRSLFMQGLGRRQIVDLYSKYIPALRPYNSLVQRMEAEKNETAAEADTLARDWAKLPDARQLAELMHTATLAHIDADPLIEPEPDADVAELRRLRAAFTALTPQAQDTYRKARDTYVEHHAKVRRAIRDRIERSEMSSERKQRLLKRMDGEFFQKVRGVYFPLARFGPYVVVVRDASGEAVTVSRAETINAAEATRKELLKQFPAADGFTVGKVLKDREFNAARDGVGRGFLAELFEELENQGAAEELQDAISQLYLASLPDLSWAKHGIHRKGTAGFSQDARRAFAQNVFHGARYLAKLRYADLLQNRLAEMQRAVDEGSDDEEYDSVKAQQVVDEMVKRHDVLMNPKMNPLSTMLTSLGFIFHLGLSPASALVNLSQTAMVAYPIMGARWGFTKSAAALGLASKQAATNRNDISRALSGDELTAYHEAVRIGAIDVTMAHDLAGIAEGEDANVAWKIRPAMRMASFMFHHAERFNRQVTFMAAYRLAREAGAAHADAFDQAVDATYAGHFDYGAANRPRIMQGNVAKVVLLFKQYAQNMIYTMSRQAYLSFKGMTPQERSEARKAFAGLLVTHAAGAGALGLPLVGTLLSVASWIGGDDDEPWDAEVALKNVLADALGTDAAAVLAHGLSRLTPWDISGRVGLDRLLLPDIHEGLEGRRAAEAWYTGLGGPVVGIGVNAAQGLSEIAKGNLARGLETMMPAAVRGPLKAWRFGSEGAVDKTGVEILPEVGSAAVAGQVLGFSPSDVRQATEARSAIYQFDKRLMERRATLMAQYARAVMAGDEDGANDVRTEIDAYNEKNPERVIRPSNLRQSVAARVRRVEQAEHGVYLPAKRRGATEAGRFGQDESEDR